MKIGKIVSLILAISLLLSSLTSCGRTVEELVEKADKILEEKPYVIEVDIDYRTNDQDVAGIFDQLERSETVMYFKDGNLRARNDLSIDYGEGDTKFISTYTVVDGILYFNINYTTDGVTRDVKSKAAIDADKKAELENKLSLVGGIGASDFSDVILVRDEDEYEIVCLGVSDEKQIELEKLLISQLESTAGSVKMTDVKMVIELDGRKYDTVTVYVEYNVVINGKNYSVGMTVELEYEYDARFDVTVPADASEYLDADIETLV